MSENRENLKTPNENIEVNKENVDKNTIDMNKSNGVDNNDAINIDVNKDKKGINLLNVDGDKEIVIKKEKKKGLGGPFRLFKSRTFTFIFLIVMTGISAFALFMLDDYNYYRPAALEVPFFKELFKYIGIKKFNVTITSWTVFIITFMVIFGFFIIWAFYKPLQTRYVITIKDGVPIEEEKIKKSRVIFNIIFFSIIVILYGFLVTIMVLVYPWHFIKFDQISMANFINLLAAVGIYILILLLPIAIITVLYLIFRLLVGIFILFAGAVSKGVMKTQGYQEALAASQITNQRLQEEVEKAMKDNLQNAVSEEATKSVSKLISSGDYSKFKAVPIMVPGMGGGGYGPQGITYPEVIFPALVNIDIEHKDDVIEEEKDYSIIEIDPTEKKTGKATKKEEDPNNHIKDMPERFQAFLANKHQIYFSLSLLRSFIAGLNASRIILLEGLSGTGKTTLPRLFNEFIGGKASFYPVQSTWRDKTDLIGYFSDFAKQYKETEFLKGLYEGSYIPNKFNFMVLDEMNISRVEYYFADFLSVLEYPKQDWVIPIINIQKEIKLPTRLEGGKVRISDNTWFVGTLNVDDSTFTVSDKVYDRAIVIEFKELSTPFKSKYKDTPMNMSPKQLQSQFDYFTSSPLYKLSNVDKLKFIKLCDFAAETFDIKFGNRIMNQIENLFPVYIALGGSKEDALDFMFAHKILRKVDGKYDSYIGVGLTKLSKYIRTSYGINNFKETQTLIKKYQRKFI